MNAPSRIADVTVQVWFENDCWHATSNDPAQGTVSGSADIVLRTVRGWIEDAAWRILDR